MGLRHSTTERQLRPVCKVLVVEDHADTAFVLTRLLRKLGYETETARTAAEARHKLADWPADVLIIDLMLPDGDGAELLSELRACRPVAAIAFTGLGMEADRRRTKAAGFSAHLVKPGTIGELREALDAACAEPQN